MHWIEQRQLLCSFFGRTRLSRGRCHWPLAKKFVSRTETDDTRGRKRTRGHQHTTQQTAINTQHNRQPTALHSHRPLASRCRRGMQLQCKMWCGITRLYFSHRWVPRGMSLVLEFLLIPNGALLGPRARHGPSFTGRRNGRKKIVGAILIVFFSDGAWEEAGF